MLMCVFCASPVSRLMVEMRLVAAMLGSETTPLAWRPSSTLVCAARFMFRETTRTMRRRREILHREFSCGCLISAIVPVPPKVRGFKSKALISQGELELRGTAAGGADEVARLDVLEQSATVTTHGHHRTAHWQIKRAQGANVGHGCKEERRGGAG